jgi:hypothetical protein
MTLTLAEETLVSIGASVGSGSHSMLARSLAKGAEVGLDAAALLQAIADAECVKRSAYNELAVAAREFLGQTAELPPACCDDTSVAKEFVSVGSALAANAPLQLQKHIEQARGVGIEGDRLTSAIRIAEAVQRQAAEATLGEAEDLTEAPAPPAAAPIFLMATPPAEEVCGPDCGCASELTEPAAANAEPCCGNSAATPAMVAAAPVTATQGKCC